jgi:hypothetical protein
MDATTIIRQDQVSSLYEDIKLEIEVELLDLVEENKKKLDDEYRIWFEEAIKPYDKLIQLNKEYATYAKNVDEDIINGKADYYHIRIRYATLIPSQLDRSKIVSNLKEIFYETHNLSTEKINTFISRVLDKKIKAILCTLNNASYEDIVKAVYDKLNLNDLFDNRHKYLN